ncbi:cytochrome-c peroxidase [Pedobacter gandavensis]|uniref:cytochrome-c peroxidase n=1 Tax=Pedobacter gandavensis TaxID=2679963 RepID=UPI00292D4167|nr:cytochrome c peroxidase [Pedobacter gandavensis]
MKKNKVFVFAILIFALVMAVFAFGLSTIKTDVAVRRPVNFPEIVQQGPALTVEGVTLGQKLFDDALLSKNGKIACASCHNQVDGYASKGIKINPGVNEAIHGTMNTPALMNLQWKTSFFRDGRESHLQNTAINALTSPAEMGETMDNVVKKLNASPVYKHYFKSVLGVDTIQQKDVTGVMEQYLLSLVSANSRYDKLVVKQEHTFNPAELEGFKLFKEKCASCHTGDLFTDESLRNIGTATGNTGSRKFKVPSLRNIEVTAPYFHDGRFQTLEEVMVHYATGVHQEKDLDPLMQTNGKAGIPMTEDEQKKVIAFLKTLTDHAFINKMTLQ